MGFIGKNNNTDSQSSSTRMTNPFDYFTVDIFFKDNASFYNNMPIPKILQNKSDQIEERWGYINAYLNDPNIPLDAKAKVLQKVGNEISDFYHLAYTHEVLNYNNKKEKGLADMGREMLLHAYRITKSYMQKSGIDIPLDYFHFHMYILGTSTMAYISQIANLSGVIIPKLITKYVQAVVKMVSVHISKIKERNQQLQDNNDNMKSIVKEWSINEGHDKFAILSEIITSKFHDIEDEVQKEVEKIEKPNNINIIDGGVICPNI